VAILPVVAFMSLVVIRLKTIGPIMGIPTRTTPVLTSSRVLVVTQVLTALPPPKLRLLNEVPESGTRYDHASRSGWDSSAVDAYSCPRCGVSCSNPFAICQCELPASPYDHPSQPESTGRPTPYAHSGSNVPSRPENVRRSTSYSWTPTHDRPFQPQSTPLYDVCSRGKGW
jgi:hypothetical protein